MPFEEAGDGGHIPSLAAGPVTTVLVDDAPAVRLLVRSRLRVDGRFDVVGEGSNGHEAVRLAEELHPQLMLLDVSMPEMDGIETLEVVRQVSPATTVVMFSGFEERGFAEQATSLGAADYLTKSLPVDQLGDRLMAALGGAGPSYAGADVGAEPREAGGGGGDARDPTDAVEMLTDDGVDAAVLGEHLERFRAVFDEAAMGMATVTLTGRVVRANAALERITGVSHDDLLGSPYVNLVAPDAVEAVTGAIQHVVSGVQDVAHVEHRLNVGGEPWVTSTFAVVRDSLGAPLYLFLQVQDITARRAAERGLRQSEERFKLLVDSVVDYAIFLLDPEGRVASWNLGAQRAKGYSADEIIGQHFSIFYTDDAKSSNHPARELMIATAEGRYEEEGWRVRKDGSLFWANVVITALRDDSGDLVGFAKVTRDITERRRMLDQLDQAAKERTEFLAVTAHELRGPVGLINGFASTVRDHWDAFSGEERQEMLNTLVRTGQRLSRLVEDLLTAARLESRALDMRPAPVYLPDVVREVVSDFSLGNSVEVQVDVPDVVVVADRGRLQQMLVNYLSNAVRHGVPPFALRAVVAGDAVELRVSDQGPGVRPDLVPQLFGKFIRDRTGQGTGLGLFIVREMARGQGGDAWYEHAADGGACFVLRLPMFPETAPRTM